MKIEKLKLVVVDWVDSYRNDGWESFPGIQKNTDVLYCRSVGWLINANKNQVLIVPHVSSAKDRQPGEIRSGCGFLGIPRRAILKMRTLRCPR